MKTLSKKSPIYLLIALAIVLLGSLSIPQPALAFEDIPDGYIPADQVIYDDVFISAEKVIIDGIVYGDVIAAAGEVIVNGTVEGNLIMNTGVAEVNGFVSGSLAFAGQQLVINSIVDGSIYFAGVELILGPDAQINRSVLFGGYSLYAQAGSVIGTDLHGTGYQVTLDGFIGHNVLLDMAAADVSGTIAGDAHFHVGDPSVTQPNMGWMQIWTGIWGMGSAPEQRDMGLRISPEAEIQGKLTYNSGAEQADTIQIEPGGGTEFTQTFATPANGRTAAELWLIGRLRELLTLLALGGLAIWLLPKPLCKSNAQLRARPGRSLGWGILGLIGGYAVILVALMLVVILGILLAIVTLGGLANAVFGIGLSGVVMIFSIFTLLVIYGSKVVVAYYLGDLILSRVRGESDHLRVMALAMGLAIYIILRFIPIVSTIVGILATLLGLGGMARAVKIRKKEKLLAENQEPFALDTESEK